MKQISRRDFLRRTAAASAALALPASSWALAPGANGDIRVAVIGFNGRGGDHIEGFLRLPGVRVVALCDADRNVLRAGEKRLEARGSKVSAYGDVRRLLEDKAIDAVSTATPNHWHALIAIWSCQAGKDVYVEKPVSHDVREGRRIVEAARAHGRIVQCGTQARSRPGVREAMAMVREGRLGKVKLARGICYKPRRSIGKTVGPQPVPEGIDYDLWTGPAPLKPLRRKNLHYDWHWIYDTGNGDLGNQGIHEMDLCRWALGETRLSPRVISVGGRFGYDDDGETPNTQIVFHDYDRAPLIFEVRGLPSRKELQEKGWGLGDMDTFPGAPAHGGVGAVIVCEGGTLVIPSERGPVLYDPEGRKVRDFAGGGDHYANFIAAVRSRKVEDLTADILEGHLSSALCHTGMISHRLGKAGSPGEIREAIRGEKEAAETFERFQAHLTANGIDLSLARASLGPWL